MTKKETQKYRIVYGKYDIVLKSSMVDSMKNADFNELKKTYIEMFKIFERLENTSNRTELYKLNQSIEPLEFKMQKLLGFKVDRNYHRYWHECPKCTCPVLDNRDVCGTGIRYYNEECIIHGKKTRNLVQRKDKLKKIEKGI